MNFIPSNRFLNEVTDPSLQVPAVFLDLFDEVNEYGTTIESRTGVVAEVIGARFTLWKEDLLNLETYFEGATFHPFKAPTNNGRRVTIDQYINSLLAGEAWSAFKAEGSLAYAESLKSIPDLVSILTADESSRRAVHVMGPDSCFTSFQVLIREGKLHIFLNARSVNLTHGLPFDALLWYRKLAKPLSKALNKDIAGLHFQVGSLHMNVARKA